MAEAGFFKCKEMRLRRSPQRHEDEGGKSADDGGDESQRPPVPFLPFHLEFQTADVIIGTGALVFARGIRLNEMIFLEQYRGFHVRASLRLVNFRQGIIIITFFAKTSMIKDCDIAVDKLRRSRGARAPVA